MSIIDYSWDFTKEEFNLDLDFFNEKEQEDKLWQAKTGLNLETLCGAIETIIFMSDKPINLMKIKNQIDNDIPLRVVHESIARLQGEYEQKHHGIRLMEVAQGYQFRTKATFANLVQKMFKVQSLQLSPTAVEVLAIIAYKQPISKTDVESIRGVDSSHVIRALMDRRLVKITGRSNEMGRPTLYGTSAEFLEVFNLNELTDLPSEIELDEIANANEIGEIADIRNIVMNTDKEKFVFDEIDELDELSTSIREISSETFFTKSLKDLEKKRVTEEGVERKSAFDILEEHVNLSQVIDQNKTSADSETPTSCMEPKSVAANMLHHLLNSPELLNVDMDDEDGDSIESMKEFSSESLASDMSVDDLDEIDEALDSTLAQSAQMLDEFMNSEEIEDIAIESSPVEAAEIPALPEEVQSATELEKEELAMALDDAFDDMFGPSDADPIIEDHSEGSSEELDLSELVPGNLESDTDSEQDQDTEL